MERDLTIARGLSRLKTIDAQLDKITRDISQYGAWNNKRKHPLGDNKGTVEQTHNQAQEYINSLYQQHNDLIKEYMVIKTAIDKTNMNTKVKIAEKEMTIYEALLYKRNVQDYYSQLRAAYGRTISNAQCDVDRYNNQFVSANEEVKKVAMADVSYFIDKNKIEEINGFLVDFTSEVNGTLNEVNAVTKLIFE